MQVSVEAEGNAFPVRADPVQVERVLTLVQEGGEPDLLVADHALGPGSGEELARRVRELHPATRVLLMSGSSHGEQIAAASCPLVELLAKPFTADQLLDRVEMLVGAADEG